MLCTAVLGSQENENLTAVNLTHCIECLLRIPGVVILHVVPLQHGRLKIVGHILHLLSDISHAPAVLGKDGPEIFPSGH